MAAARAMLDEVHEALPTYADDSNTYALGRIAHHNVVIACLPATQYGTNNAANVLTNLTRTFPSIRAGLMVGIGGGAPSNVDVRLGDIVVGTRVTQYDLGKIIGQGQFHRTAFSRIPSQLLGTAVSSLRSQHELRPSRVSSILQQKLAEHPRYTRPSVPDRLFKATYDHESLTASCDACDHSRLVPRSRRMPDNATIHYGAIASGNQGMRSGITRDIIARQLDVICFEMEAAGLMDVLHCLPIRGICDYSDSHKNKEWQRYAAATAAAYARELLEELPVAMRYEMAAYMPNLRKLAEWFRRQFQVTSAGTCFTEQDALHKRRQRLLDSLRFERIEFRKSAIKPADGKTCEWFLNSPAYQSWLDPGNFTQRHGFLWMSGKPGAGKSTIMKFAYLNMKGKVCSKYGITASFFFNARGEFLEKSVCGMYRSLLLQLLEGYPDLQAVLDNPELVRQSQNDCPSLNNLKDLFCNAVTTLGERSFTCFVDALDESDEQEVVDMVQYFEEVAEQCAARGVALRICFSSRHYPYITIQHGIRLTLEDQPGHAADMEVYVRNRLQIGDIVLMDELRPQLFHKAAGVFMWVVLVVDILNKEYRRGGLALRKRLAEIPSDLSELFKDILRRDTEDMEHLLLCILWILFATRPLNPQEFYHALWAGMSLKGLADPQMPDTTSLDAGESVNRFNRHVISSSKGLAEVTKVMPPAEPEELTVQFIHESVRDFLIKDKGLLELWADLGFDLKSQSHETLKECCYSYMNNLSVRAAVNKYSLLVRFPLPVASNWRMEIILQKCPFRKYATDNVLYHADAAATAVPQNDFLSLFHVSDWVIVNNLLAELEYGRHTLNTSLFYLLAHKECSQLIRTRLKDDPHIHVYGGKYNYALFAALHGWDMNAITVILKLPWTVIKDVVSATSKSMDVNNYWETIQKFTPLSWAAKEGLAGVVKSLLQAGESINETDFDGQSPLSRATEQGNKRIVSLLIDEGADVNTSDYFGTAPLSWASLHGHESIASLLITHGADVNWDKNGWNPLVVASSLGHEAVVRLLIDNGAHIDSANRNGMTPLCWASQEGREAIVRILLDKGADVNARSEIGRTPLIYASEYGRDGVVELLIEGGADVDSKDQNGLTSPLEAINGHKAVGKLLIEAERMRARASQDSEK